MRRRVLVPLALLLGLVAALGIAAAWLLGTESGLRWAWERVRARVPGELSVESLAGRIAGPIEVRGLRYRDGEMSVLLDTVSLDWSPTALVTGRLRVGTIAADGLRVALPPPAQEPATREPKKLARLPLALSIGEARLRDVAITRAGAAPIEIRSLDIVEATLGRRALELEHLRLDAERFSVVAEGGLALDGDEQRIDVTWRFAPPDFAPVAGHGTVSGTLARLIVEQELTEPLPAALRAELRDLLVNLQWHAELSLPAIDPRKLRPAWPSLDAAVDLGAQGNTQHFTARGRVRLRHAGGEVLGRLEAAGDARAVHVERLDLALAGTPAEAHLKGQWVFAQRRFDVQASWQALQWPIESTAIVASPGGDLRIAGTLDDYRIEGTMRTEGPRLPPARWQLAGRGDTTALDLETLRGDVLDGRIDAVARLAWSPQLAWSVTAKATSLDPGTIWPDWPGELVAAVRAQGSGNALKLEIERLEGQLRGSRVSARGQLVRQGEHYPDVRLDARSTGTRVRVRGRVTTAWDLSFELKASELSAVWPEVAGEVDGKGRIQGPRVSPRIEAELAGRELSYQAFAVQTLNLTGAVDLSDATTSRASLEARGLVAQGRALDRASVRAEGRVAEHTVSAHAAMDDLAVTLRLMGGYHTGVWRGVLRQAIVNGEAAGFWTLASPAALRLARDRVVLEKTCLRAQGPDVCLSADWDPRAISRFTLSADAVPLALLTPLLPERARIRGTVSGDANVELDQARLTRARAEFTLSSGRLILATPAAATGAVSFEGGSASLLVDDGLRAHAEIDLAGEDRVRLDLALPRFDGTAPAGPTQPLEGRLVARIADVAPLLPLFPEVEQLRGAAQADLRIAGTLAEPQLRGEASVRDGSARIPGAGITLEDMQVTATAKRNDVLALRGQARSGKGRIEIDGTLALESASGWRAKLRVAGERFQAVDLREASVLVSPNLSLEVAPRHVAIDGEIRIPKARLTPRPRLGADGTAAVPVSGDVVIVNAPEQEQETVPARPWTVSGEVQVILGDDVTFEGFGLSGKIAGQFTVIETPGRVTAGRGEVRIEEGRYEAFGQKLDIERGRLLFAGGPIDNPGIDARAVRKIEEVTAGITVKGTLREPDFVLFSEPAMAQADALSYLLFGHPVESANVAQGRTLAGAAAALRLTGGELLAQRIGARFGFEEVSIEGGTENQDAALVLGRQLSPRLYINYSIGLFEQVNIFRIRYKLSAHWALQAESGPYSGGDLLFQIER